MRSRGFILIDIILGLALSALMVTLIGVGSMQAQDVFDKAKRRQEMLDVYEIHKAEFEGMIPYETRSRSYEVASSSSKVNIEAKAKWYGNDRIETLVNLGYASTYIEFKSVRAYPYADVKDVAGIALCAVDFMNDGELSIKAITLPINPLLPLTDLIVRGGVAYVSADSNVAADPDILIFDIAERSNPSVTSSLNTGPGISALALAGEYLYAAAASTAAQLHVIRLDSLAAPILAKKYKLPLPMASTSPPLGTAIFYNKNRIYLGTDKWDGEEFSVIDVSFPESLTKIGGLETGSKINNIFVRNNLAYVAASDESQLRYVNMSNSTSPYTLDIYSPSGWSRQEGSRVNYFEDNLDFARTSGGFDIKVDHELFSLGSTTSSAKSSVNISGGVYGLVRDRDHVYAATRDLNHELSVFDSNLSTTSAKYYPLPVQPQAMTCDRDSLFVLAKTAPVIYEIK